MTAVEPELFDVAVPGGALRVARWGPPSGPPVVLAVHGLTSSHRFWALVGPLVADRVTLVAPDLRGRGDSAALPGPYGIARHVEDCVAVLDAVGAQRAVLCGHSMGGLVVANLAARHPERAERVLLVDGGAAVAGELAPDADVEAVLAGIVGPSLERLERRFASRDEYRAFWRAHPAFATVPGALTDAYADHDLTGEPPELRSKVAREAVLADGRDTLVDREVLTAVERLPCPAAFLYAERGMVDQPVGLYPPEEMAALAERVPNLRIRLVPAVNHFSIGLTDGGAAVIAEELTAV